MCCHVTIVTVVIPISFALVIVKIQKFDSELLNKSIRVTGNLVNLFWVLYQKLYYKHTIKFAERIYFYVEAL